MAVSAAKAPSVPATGQVSNRAQAEFQQIKQELSSMLDGISSWELSPNTFERVRMKFTEAASDAQAKALIAVLGK